MQGAASIYDATWPCYFLLGRGLTSYPRTTRCLQGYLHHQGRWAHFLYRERSGALLDRYLTRLFHQYRAFFLLGPANDHFHTADVHHDPTIRSSALFAPHVSFPCLDAKEEIDLQVTRSQGWWSLQLCQTKHMWKGELSKLLEATGYWIAVGVKLLHVVDETFCSISTYGANSRYLDCLTSKASATQCKLAKNGVQQQCVGRLFDD